MKKLFSLFLSAMMMVLASCTQEDQSNLPVGQEVTTQVNLLLPTMQRVAHDEPALNGMRVYLIVSHEDQIIKVDSLMNVNQNSINFNVRLVTGLEYDIAAWADFGADYYTVSAAEGRVSMKLGEGNAITGSDNKRDAYYGIVKAVSDVSDGISITLKRPFGLVKVVAQDYDEPTVGPLGLTSYSTTINMPTALNLLDGNADTDTSKDVVISASFADITTGELSYDYIFANAQKELIDFNMDYKDADGTTQTSYSFTEIPLQRNYKTNISGNVFTKVGSLTITIDQKWEDKYDHIIDGGALTDALVHATDGDVITLVAPITLFEPLSMTLEEGETVVLDLNENVLTFDEGAANDITVKNGTLFIKGGKINSQKVGSVDGCIAAFETGAVVMEDVEYTTTGCAFFIKDEGTLIIKNSTVHAGAYAVTSNASESPQQITVTLENSTFTGSSPIMLNVPSTITIDDCDINGTTQGVVVRGGTATVSNSTITLTYNDNDYATIASYFKERDWGSGNMVNCAALTIGNKGTGAYQYPTNVTLINTELALAGAHGDAFPALYAYANQGTGLGVTLNYDENCIFAKEPIYGSNNITVNGSVVIPNEE